MRVRGRVATFGLVAVTAALSLSPFAPAAHAGGTYVICAAGVNAFVWDAGGDGVSWNDAPNWDVNCTPGLANQPQDDVVTIPAWASVVIDDGESAYIDALHNAGTLTITPGGVLKTINDSESETTLLQGLLFGTGRFSVTGTMEWQATAQGAATMATRRCSIESCASPAAQVGTTVVEVGATIEINGRGVNLQDQRVIENHGTVRVSGDGYVAADYGTTFRNLRLDGDPAPRFVISNDRGYYQGFATAGFGLSDFINTGKIVKNGGAGLSVIDADYARTDAGSSATGSVLVTSGQLTVLSPTGTFTNQATVKQGSAFGNGAPGPCVSGNDVSLCNVIRTDTGDSQAASVALTKLGTTRSKVTIQERTDEDTVDEYGVPVRVETPNAAASTKRPLVFRIFLDSSTLGGDSAATVAQSAPVQRRATLASPYVTLPSCGATGPTSTTPCVARAQSVNETATLGGDVVLVVKSLSNSRYRVGRIIAN